MFTKNYYKLIASHHFGNNPGDFIAVDGTTVSTATTPSSAYSVIKEACTNPAFKNGMKYKGTYFGNGSAEPSLDDYNLSGDVLISGTASDNVTVTTDEHGITQTTIYTVTNTGTTDFTISEVGAVGEARAGSSIKGYVLIDHTLLDTPVTIPAGGIGQVTYTIRMNYPTA